MGLPAKRTTSTKRDKRRSHHALTPFLLGACAKCGKPVRGHAACPNCGFYRGKEIVNVLVKLDKKERKLKEKELAKHEKEHAHEHGEKEQTASEQKSER